MKWFVIVLSWNQRDATLACLDSLHQALRYGAEFMLVDRLVTVVDKISEGPMVIVIRETQADTSFRGNDRRYSLIRCCRAQRHLPGENYLMMPRWRTCLHPQYFSQLS
jgi:hypothetical protein